VVVWSSKTDTATRRRVGAVIVEVEVYVELREMLIVIGVCCGLLVRSDDWMTEPAGAKNLAASNALGTIARPWNSIVCVTTILLVVRVTLHFSIPVRQVAPPPAIGHVWT